jgi:hypothetical protein
VPAKKPTSFKFNEAEADLLQRLSEHLGVNKHSVIVLALRLLAKREGQKV